MRGKDDGEIWYPTGVAVDKYNNIYVADHGNHRIQVGGKKTCCYYLNVRYGCFDYVVDENNKEPSSTNKKF